MFGEKYTIFSAYVHETSDEDRETLDSFDNTKLVAINTCPIWGIGRYTHHKTMSSEVGRAMALEAGGAAHEVFAAHRYYSLQEFGEEFYGRDYWLRVRDIVTEYGTRLFGDERIQQMYSAVDTGADFETRVRQFAITALYNCGFYDDARDKRRTITNIEEMCLAYMDRFSWRKKLPVVLENGFVGIEVPVDVVIEFVYGTESDDKVGSAFKKKIRFIGKADGVHYADDTKTEVRVHENKTASRLGEAWEMSWETNHQPTGYIVALTHIIGQTISRAEIYGTCLPLPKTFAIDGLSRVVAIREQWKIVNWFEWVLHTVLLHDQHKDDPVSAPMYTHSCNRYFRPCSYIIMCAMPNDERAEMFNQMRVEKWSPLHEGTDND